MATTYTKSLSSDFGGVLNPAHLQEEINNNGVILINCTSVAVGDPTSDSVKITFSSALGGPALTELNNVISAHDPDPLVFDLLVFQTVTASESPYKVRRRSILCDTSSGNIILELPKASRSVSAVLGFKKISISNTVTIEADNGETVDGQVSKTLTSNNERLVITSDGTNWVIADNTTNIDPALNQLRVAIAQSKGAIEVGSDYGVVDLNPGVDGETLIVDSNEDAGLKWGNLTQISGYNAAEHIDWTADAGADNIHPNNITAATVTQHQSSIDHNALANYSVAQHRVINDAGTSVTELWSASKISSDLAGKAAIGHTHTTSSITDWGSAWDTRLGTKSTSDLVEGSNLYFTNARADARITAQKGANNGLATLDGSGKVPASQLNITGLTYQGTWNANTNTPTITSSTGTQGHYYVVGTAGTTNIDGETDWQPGDWIVFNGSVWEKSDHSASVTSVAGKQGVITLEAGDITSGTFADARIAGSSVTQHVGLLSHNSLANLTSGDPHTQYPLLAGRSGGQTIIGGAAAGEDLTLVSTSHSTKGNIICADVVKFTSNEFSTSSSTGALVVSGGIGATGGMYAAGVVRADEIRCHSEGSTPGAPALMGFDGMASGEANRFQFGDSANVWQNGYGSRQTIGSYWGIELRGNRRTITAPSFPTGTTGDPNISIINENNNVALKVYGNSTQTENLQEWVTNTDSFRAGIDNNGNVNIIGEYRIGGTRVNIPAGGTTGQVLSKVNNSDYNVQWTTTSGGGDVTGPVSSIDMGLVRFNGTGGKTIEGVGIRHYGALAADPSSPTPAAGDEYYNTVINEKMCYDASRGKWLSITGYMDGCGVNGNTSAGAFFRRWNGMPLDTNLGAYIPKGTVTRIGYTTSNSTNWTLEVLVNGVVICELNSGGSASAFKDDFNHDFPSGNISFRNKAGGTTASNCQVACHYKLRA